MGVLFFAYLLSQPMSHFNYFIAPSFFNHYNLIDPKININKFRLREANELFCTLVDIIK